VSKEGVLSTRELFSLYREAIRAGERLMANRVFGYLLMLALDGHRRSLEIDIHTTDPGGYEKDAQRLVAVCETIYGDEVRVPMKLLKRHVIERISIVRRSIVRIEPRKKVPRRITPLTAAKLEELQRRIEKHVPQSGLDVYDVDYQRPESIRILVDA